MRQFKGIWIPREILEHPLLQPVDKILWGDIDSFNWNEHTFFKSNDTIAEEYGVSERTISRAVGRLKEAGLVTVTSNGRTRHLCPVRVDNLSSLPRQYGDSASPICLPNKNNIIKQSKKTIDRTRTPKNFEECEDYFFEIMPAGNAKDQAIAFYDYYSANGWVQGKNKPLKDWKACARLWVRRSNDFKKEKNGFKGENFSIDGINDFVVNG